MRASERMPVCLGKPRMPWNQKRFKQLQKWERARYNEAGRERTRTKMFLHINQSYFTPYWCLINWPRGERQLLGLSISQVYACPCCRERFRVAPTTGGPTGVAAARRRVTRAIDSVFLTAPWRLREVNHPDWGSRYVICGMISCDQW